MRTLVVSLMPFLLSILVGAPAASANAAERPSLADAVSGLELRSIGPALMGGRIADIAIHPGRSSTWYLAVGSGGVWKTVNAGTTWTPIFDDQPSYSIGCVTIDPTNPEVVWVGTGENVSGRHVGWGDGVYKSLDGGTSWRQMGLERSEHISEIVVDPRDGDTVYVAAEGPLWAAGGERGLYKTTDGGATWTAVLTIDEDTGITSLELDPRDPDTLYAASYQRRRHVWSLLAGGPHSGIHKSTDGGQSWRRLEKGLPEGDMGKIGLALSPVDPDVVYATIEADDEERGFYRSLDRGESWSRRNPYISNGTGPHYYQEIVASPHDVDRVYQMDVFLHVTADGGATFEVLGNGREKHSDNHALVIDPRDPKHLLAGTDASLYESFDDGLHWRQFPNLPISQFYKLALDDAEPFYNILGGAQDLGTLLGPSGTTNVEGISNRDWFVPLGADGYSSAFDPDDPNIVYMEWQGGRLQRFDRRSDELLDIQPVPAPGEPAERFNWDAPVRVSPHAPGRLYFASQRLWRSDDRGSSWRPVSGDLTRNRNRYEMAVRGRVQSVDALYDNGAMSLFGTITTVAESPLDEGLLYVGTDDGLLQVSEDGGANWRRAGSPPGAPDLSFVNDVKASLHDPDTVFAALDAHKLGDLSPLLYESRDRGKSWRAIHGDLPQATIVWALAQDHELPDMLFAATEFGLYFTPDRGVRWVELAGGVPTIAFRDLAIQRRESDLVGATFGRGFYVLDDYSPLRRIAAKALDGEHHLFAVRDARWFVPSVPLQAKGKPSLGSTEYTAKNPPFGALFTFYLADEHRSAKEERRTREDELAEKGDDIPFPGWDQLRDEALESAAQILLIVRDADGRAVRRIEGPGKAGLHRVAWDLRRPPPDPVDLEVPGFRPPWAGDPQGPLAPPGVYTVELARSVGGQIERLGEPETFEVRPVRGFSLDEPDFADVTAFQETTAEVLRRARSVGAEIQRTGDRLRHLRAALAETPRADPGALGRLEAIESSLADLGVRLSRDPIRGRFNEASPPSIQGRAGQVAGGHWDSRQTPTATQRQSLAIAETELTEVTNELRELLDTALAELEAELEAAGAPWTPGRLLPPSGG